MICYIASFDITSQIVHALYIVQLILLFVKFRIASLNGLLLTKSRKSIYQALHYNKRDQWRRKKDRHFTSMSAKSEECKKFYGDKSLESQENAMYAARTTNCKCLISFQKISCCSYYKHHIIRNAVNL